MNTQIDMNFGSLNQIEMVMEIEKGFKKNPAHRVESGFAARPRSR
jgi:hypothetical protein